MVTEPPVHGISFSLDEFAELFPFYIAFEPSGVITHVGPSFKRVNPEARRGQRVGDLLQPHRPGEPLDSEHLAKACGQLFTVVEKRSGVLLRGEFRSIGGQFLFLGTPWFHDVAQLTVFNLTLRDFATHDPTLDLLQSLQLHKIASADMQELTRRLAASEARLQALFNSVPLGLAILDERQQVTLSNRQMSELAGDDGLAKAVAHCGKSQTAADAPEPVTFEIERETRARKRHLLFFAFPIPPKHGETALLGIAARDITIEKNTDMELRATAERRREYLEMQREFVSMVSHEFRTPLTAIEGAQYLLRRAVKEPGALSETIAPRIEKWLGLQSSALVTLKELVDQVLVLNRIEHESGKHLLTAHAPAPLIEKAVESFNDSQASRRVVLRNELPQNFQAEMDPGLVRKAVENLISNGLKYSWPEHSVQVRLWSEAGDWAVAVVDQGRGIPAVDQQRLFRPFFRGTNVHNVPGSGLGLAIVARAVNYHAGVVDFESKENIGSRFTLRFPRVPPNHDTNTSSRNPFLKQNRHD